MALGVAASRSLAYVADSHGGLEIVDISDAEAPRLLGTTDTVGWANDVAVAGRRLYVASSAGLEAFDLRDRGNPAAIGVCASASMRRVATEADRVLVQETGDEWGGALWTGDGDCAGPLAIGDLGLAEGVTGMERHGHTLYATSYWGGGLQIVDVSAPRAPKLLGSFPAVGDNDVAVQATSRPRTAAPVASRDRVLRRARRRRVRTPPKGSWTCFANRFCSRLSS